jgi:hypothetical protein
MAVAAGAVAVIAGVAVAVVAAARAAAAEKAAQQQLLIDQLTARLADAAKAAAASAVSEKVAEDEAGLAVDGVATHATTDPRCEMSDVSPPQLLQHAFSHAPAALRIFRFAADTAPRVLELAHVSKFLRECAVEFGSADATLPGAMRNENAAKRYFKLRAVVQRNAARCPWLAEKLLARRSVTPMPAAALAPDVTRHDVNWGAEGARRHEYLVVSGDGSALALPMKRDLYGFAWAQSAVGVMSGKHWFSVSVTKSTGGWVKIGWVDRALQADGDSESGPGFKSSRASGAMFMLDGRFFSAALLGDQEKQVPEVECPCTVGCLLDADAGTMTVFVDGNRLTAQCEYTFPTDGREWAPSVGLGCKNDALFSNAV